MKHKKEIEIIARGVCIKSGKLLLCHTKGAPHTYLPGGHVEFGERARDSLCREIREELGVRSRIGRFLGVVEHKFARKHSITHEINFVFEFRTGELDPRKKPVSQEDYIEFQWIPVRNLLKCDLEPAGLRRLITLWLSDSFRADRWAGTF